MAGAAAVQPGFIALVAVEIKPERRDDFLAAMKIDVEGSRVKALDPGCIHFSLLHSKEDPNKFYFYEAYKDKEANAFHKTTSHYNAWAEFKASGGVVGQSVRLLETASIPGAWAFQADSVLHSQAGAGVIVTVDIKPESVDAFVQALEVDVKCSRSLLADPGLMRFDFLRFQEEPNKFIFVELYLNDDAAAFHKTTAHYDLWAKFKATGGVASQTVEKVDTTSLPGTWPLQTPCPGVDQPMVASVVKLTLSPEGLTGFPAAIGACVVGARDKSVEPGCIRFDLLESKDTPNTFLVLRAFATAADYDHHQTTAHCKAWEVFAQSGGVVSQEESRFDVPSIPGGWAFQDSAMLSSRVESGVLVTVDLKPDRVEDFVKAMHVDVMGSRNDLLDAGCLRFDLLHDAEKPSRYHFLEAYTTDEAAASHKTTAHYKAWADFKASGGVEAQSVQKWQVASPALPGFQSATARLGNSEMPLIGFGCYKVGAVPASASTTPGAPPPPQGPEVCEQVILDAISCGYRCFDSAQFYMNEAWVGTALKKSGVARDKLFIASKVWNNIIYEGPAAVKAQVDKSIEELQCGYLDLCLVHWPVPGKHVDAYKALREYKAAGKIKQIGVSNYTVEDYEELRAGGGFDADGTDKPVLNQFEVNPLLFRKKTIEYFQKEGVHIQSYRGLMQANTSWGHPVLQEVCQATGRSPAQVLGRFLVQQGISHIPKASNAERMRQNMAVFGFALSPAHMEKLSGLTTPEALEAFQKLYTKCIWRDTPQEGSALPQKRTLE